MYFSKYTLAKKAKLVQIQLNNNKYFMLLHDGIATKLNPGSMKTRKIVNTKNPPKNSCLAMAAADSSCFNNPLMVLNNVPNTDAPKEYNKPKPKFPARSKGKANRIPMTVINPKSTSFLSMGLFNKNGSNRAVKKAEELNPNNETVTFDTLAASKKHSQCKATKAPTPQTFHRFRGFDKWACKNFPITHNPIQAKPILHQTNCSDGKSINFPKMAVNPQMKTIPCKDS